MADDISKLDKNIQAFDAVCLQFNIAESDCIEDIKALNSILDKLNQQNSEYLSLVQTATVISGVPVADKESLQEVVAQELTKLDNLLEVNQELRQISAGIEKAKQIHRTLNVETLPENKALLEQYETKMNKIIEGVGEMVRDMTKQFVEGQTANVPGRTIPQADYNRLVAAKNALAELTAGVYQPKVDNTLTKKSEEQVEQEVHMAIRRQM